MSLHCWDGTALLAYTGLAEVPPSGESMFDWIRTTLRGETRSFEDSLRHLQFRLNRDIASARDRRFRRAPLIIVAAGVVGTRPDPNAPLRDGKMGWWVITNQSWPGGPTGPPRIDSAFRLEGGLVDRVAVSVLGSGRAPVENSSVDRELLRRATTYRPSKAADYLGLLAAVNRRAASRSEGTVSPWCSGIYMPEIGQDLQCKAYSEHGDPEPMTLPGMPSMLFGIDLTDMTRQMMNAMRNSSLGLPGPPDGDPNDSVRGRP